MRAYGTLLSGCAFWESHAGTIPRDSTPRAATIHARLSGNRLRELDRFLSVLLDELAIRHGDADHDAPSFARQKNTPRKLLVVEGMFRLDHQDQSRLRATGRLSACLHHCSGVMHMPDLKDDLFLLSRDRPDADVGDRPTALLLSERAIVAICAMYRHQAGRLLHASGLRIDGAPAPLSLPSPGRLEARAGIEPACKDLQSSA